MQRLSLLVTCFMLVGTSRAQKTDAFLETLLRSHASPQLKMVLDHPDSFRYQLIYTKIDRDSKNRPSFHSYRLRVNADEYFNPASTVKMPLAFLALEKMNDLRCHGIDKNSPMLTDSAFSGQAVAQTDTSAANGLPSLAHYIKKIFLVSDNDAYNRLYEFLGQQYVNERLWQMGYPRIRITRRFVPMTEEENRHTNPIRWLRGDPTRWIRGGGGRWLRGDTGRQGRADEVARWGTDTVAYSQPPAESKIRFDFSRQVLIGHGYLDRHDSLIHAPMDFTRHNNIPLEDEQRLLQSVLFPESAEPWQRFRLTDDDYRFLYQYMSEYPSESRHPRYDTSEYFDSYTKFFMFKAGRSPIPSYIRIFNKPGWSYGFLTDVAYIADLKHNVEFMLTGVIYVNRDGILNDDKYEYDEIGYPFFKEVGNIIYQHELGRKRRHPADLGKFRLSYEADR